MARGHRVDEVPEFPLVLSNSTNNVSSTKAAKTIMSAVGAMADIEKSADSRTIRAGSGKARNRRYVQRKGPLVIHSSNSQVVKCFRNLPGCDTASVENLSLLELAPGGHLGRFCVWVQDAFEKLDALFGDYENESTLKKGYTLPRTMMTNADLARLINSDEIQSLVKAPTEVDCVIPEKRNPLRRPEVKIGLNPYHALVKEREEKANSMSKDARGKALKKKRSAAAATSKKYKAQKKQFIANASQEGDIVF
jgi:large subunit ribosomal protein L4e